jgi:hypothetical protein
MVCYPSPKLCTVAPVVTDHIHYLLIIWTKGERPLFDMRACTRLLNWIHAASGAVELFRRHACAWWGTTDNVGHYCWSRRSEWYRPGAMRMPATFAARAVLELELELEVGEHGHEARHLFPPGRAACLPACVAVSWGARVAVASFGSFPTESGTRLRWRALDQLLSIASLLCW